MDQSAADIFSSLLNPGGPTEKKAATAVRRATIVSAKTISRVREEQKEEVHAAQIAALEADKSALEEDKAALEEDLEVQKTVVASLAEDLAAAHAEDEEARAAAESRIAQLEEECVAKDREIERLKALLTEAQRTSLSASVLLEKPTSCPEKFSDEVREHVLEAIADAAKAAEASGRDRRARILEAVQCANPISGELASRRAHVKQILKDAGSNIDLSAIAALEKLGFRYISGSNHHKLEFAGIRFPVSKTPSDHRSCLNSATEICNRIF